MDINKIIIILKYEFINGIKKKSFLFISLFTPIFVIFIFASKTSLLSFNSEDKNFIVLNNSNLIDSLKSSSSIKFEYTKQNIENAKKELLEGQYFGLLIINENSDIINGDIYTSKQIALSDYTYIKSELQRLYSNQLLKKTGIDIDKLQDTSRNNIKIETVNINNNQKSDPFMPSALAYISSLLMYLCIFQFSSMVMKNISVEKNNRVVELLLSSTKTYDLISGKIIGVGLLGLVQFSLWLIIIGVLFSISKATPEVNVENMDMVTNFFINFNIISYLFYFLLYFIGGYFLYASIYAALGAIVNQYTDSQQFILPVVLPLIFTFICCYQFIGANNEIVNILSFIPLTSPVAMLVRLPFEVASYEIIISLLLLYAAIFFIIYFTGKIYKEGILAYNSRISYSSIIKWLKLKQNA